LPEQTVFVETGSSIFPAGKRTPWRRFFQRAEELAIRCLSGRGKPVAVAETTIKAMPVERNAEAAALIRIDVYGLVG